MSEHLPKGLLSGIPMSADGLALQESHGGRVESDVDEIQNHRAKAEEFDSDVNSAVEVSRSRASEDEDWESSREHARWLEERFGEKDESRFANFMLGFSDAFKINPAAANEKWSRYWAGQPPFTPRPKGEEAKEEPPAYLTDQGKREWELDKAVRDAVRAAPVQSRDRDAKQATAEVRALVKERTGMSYTEFMRVSRLMAEASHANPWGNIPVRFGMSQGTLPRTATEAREVQAVDLVQQFQGSRPDFGHYELMIADILEDPAFRRTGDQSLDLDVAYKMAQHLSARGVMSPRMEARMQQQHQHTVDQRALENVARAKQASRSVSGSPSAGASHNPRRSSGNYDDDLQADVANAYRSVSGRA